MSKNGASNVSGDLEKENAELKEQLAQLSLSLQEKSQAQVKELEESNESLRESLQTFRSELAVMRDEKSEAEEKMNSLQSAIDRLEGERTTYLREKDELNSKLDAQQEEKERLVFMVEKLQGELQALTSSQSHDEEEQSAVPSHEETEANLETQIERITDEMKKWKTECAKKEIENEELRKRGLESEAKLEEEKIELEKAQSELEKVKVALNENLQRLQSMESSKQDEEKNEVPLHPCLSFSLQFSALEKAVFKVRDLTVEIKGLFLFSSQSFSSNPRKDLNDRIKADKKGFEVAMRQKDEEIARLVKEIEEKEVKEEKEKTSTESILDEKETEIRGLKKRLLTLETTALPSVAIFHFYPL